MLNLTGCTLTGYKKFQNVAGKLEWTEEHQIEKNYKYISGDLEWQEAVKAYEKSDDYHFNYIECGKLQFSNRVELADVDVKDIISVRAISNDGEGFECETTSISCAMQLLWIAQHSYWRCITLTIGKDQFDVNWEFGE